MAEISGGDRLRAFTRRSYPETVTQVTPGVWHVLGVGHSNAVFVEGAASVILIDTLDTLERGRELSRIVARETGKDVKTILYTHGHPDHRGGAGAFLGTAPEIVAFVPKTPPLEGTQLLQDIQTLRGDRQFGYALSDEENISQGIGIREGVAHGETRAFVPPTTLYQKDRVVRDIDGVRMELVRLPGETEDQMAVWLPEQQVLCCGDNYYGCWPNLYAIRGGQYRDIAQWLHSLDALLSYPAQHLLPGHTAPLSGTDEIRTVLRGFKGAIQSILTQTLVGMNEGRTMDELAEQVRLPPEYASLPYLGEFYGCIDWTVRAIYTAYLGWFDGDPAHLHPLPPQARAEKSVALMGGRKVVWETAKEAFVSGEYQWCLELCGLLTDMEGKTAAVGILKAEALERLAEAETSANGRHYMLVCAKELRAEAGG